MKLSTLIHQIGQPLYVGLLAAAISTPVLSADLTITVPAVANSDGELMVALYNSAETLNKEQLAALRSKAVSGVMTFTFNDLAAGDYAVMLFHDVNSNGKIDTNLLGIPKEPWGASLQGKAVFGAPSWEDVRFAMPEENMALLIKLN